MQVQNFYPRPPRGGRRHHEHGRQHTDRFLSTPSARRATFRFMQSRTSWPISIHALREEGDVWVMWSSQQQSDFYPRPPRGGRQNLSRNGTGQGDFYPRPPRGGRRTKLVEPLDHPEISIHALREEGDERPAGPYPDACNFYPRPPRGGRPCAYLLFSTVLDFYPRPPRGGRPHRRQRWELFR